MSPDFVSSEFEAVRAMLDQQRVTIRRQCSGLDALGLDTALAPSTMTLGGMLSHLAYVEDYWCSVVLHDADPHQRWAEVDWAADNDFDWHTAAGREPAELLGWYDEAIAASDLLIGRALAEFAAANPGGDVLGQAARRSTRRGSVVTLRWILLHLIEEYARHAGHADLIRESIDGATAL